MDFEDTPEEAQYRAKARAFLEKNAVRREGTNMIYRAADAGTDFIKEAAFRGRLCSIPRSGPPRFSDKMLHQQRI